MLADITDIVDYADLGDNVSCVTRDANCSVWRAEGIDGQGTMTIYDVMPGIMLMFNDFTNVWNMESSFKLARGSRMLCLNYCREGRIEWGFGSDSCLYLDAGDLGIDDHSRHANLSNRFSPRALPSGSAVSGALRWTKSKR